MATKRSRTSKKDAPTECTTKEEAAPDVMDTICTMPQATAEDIEAARNARQSMAPDSLTAVANLVSAFQAAERCFPLLSLVRIYQGVRSCLLTGAPVDKVAKGLRKADDRAIGEAAKKARDAAQEDTDFYVAIEELESHFSGALSVIHPAALS